METLGWSHEGSMLAVGGDTQVPLSPCVAGTGRRVMLGGDGCWVVLVASLVLWLVCIADQELGSGLGNGLQ